ncbi:MAG: hypothetical protein ACYC8T_35595 [Myxococcaceae bacterium]
MRAPSSAVVVLLVMAGCGGKGTGGRAPTETWDVSGNYALTYDNHLTLKLGLAGGVREATVNGYGGIADFGTLNGQPLKLDLTEFCARPEVECPSETFWSSVAIDQLDVSRKLDLHVINVVNNTEHQLDAGVHAAVRGGLVDHRNDENFVVGLGIAGGANANCAALGLSLAGGRFSREGETESTVLEWRNEQGAGCTPSDGGVIDAGAADGGAPSVCRQVSVRKLTAPAGAMVDGIKEGKVALGWLGGCAFGPIVAGATFTLETGFTGSRSGNFDPPPFTLAPALVPDGGLLDAGAADGG